MSGVGEKVQLGVLGEILGEYLASLLMVQLEIYGELRERRGVFPIPKMNIFEPATAIPPKAPDDISF